ncbi:hypothetical protein ACLOAV_002418 [Pseudogymnoascus australis]
MANCIFEEDRDIIAAEVGRRVKKILLEENGQKIIDAVKQAHEDSGKIILHHDLVTTGVAACCKGVAMMGVERRKEVATAGDRRKLFEELDAKTKATMRDIRKIIRIDGDEEDGQHLSKKRV